MFKTRFCFYRAPRLRSLGFEVLENRVVLTGYNFAKITDSVTDAGFGLLTPGAASINDAGSVAFRGYQGLHPFVVFKSDGEGGSPSPISVTAGPHTFIGQPSINNLDQVAFVVRVDDFTTPGGSGTSNRLYISNGAFTTQLRLWPDYGLLSGSGDVSINDFGIVAFDDYGYSSVLRKEGVMLTTDYNGPPVARAGGEAPAINNSGDIAWTDGYDTPLAVESSGTTMTYVLPGINTLAYAPSLNNSGSVAFVTRSGELGVFEVKNGILTELVDTSGPFSRFGAAAINDLGQVAFSAVPDDAEPDYVGGVGIAGVYVILDTTEDLTPVKVLAPGDELYGSIVTSAYISREGINNSGQLAITAKLANGVTVLVRANPSDGTDINIVSAQLIQS